MKQPLAAGRATLLPHLSCGGLEFRPVNPREIVVRAATLRSSENDRFRIYNERSSPVGDESGFATAHFEFDYEHLDGGIPSPISVRRRKTNRPVDPSYPDEEHAENE